MYIQRLVKLPDLNSDMWNENHDLIIKDFLNRTDKKIMVFFVDSSNQTEKPQLVVQFEVPTKITDIFVYFIKSHYSQEINSKEIFQKHVQYGTFSGNHLTSLLRLSSGLYAPLFFGNKTWPDSKKITFQILFQKQ